MKRIAFFLMAQAGMLAVTAQKDSTANKDSFYILSPVEVRSVRASDLTPVTKTNLTRVQIQKQNLGQDLPFLLNQTPSVVINSDAGNGFGYTGIRIRGTDATRINVTLNGIPYNDAESQGTFFVDLPDFSSSVNSIQIQRGVGTSTNGAGAFGGTINLSTNEVIKDRYFEFNNTYGSFNSWKNTAKIGSGLVGGHFTIDARYSNVTSDGYIDRAFTKLRSFAFSTAYIGKSNTLRFNLFKGYEKTYQAWNGVSEADIKNGKRTVNSAGTEKPGEPYDNETDNYWQDHYQLFYTHNFSKHFSFNTAFFLTAGNGYYEQYKAGEDYAAYGLPYPTQGTDTFFTTDLIRRLWLDNKFYGNTFSFQYKKEKTELIVGGAYTKYDGNHYGRVIWAENGLGSLKNWYDLDATKKDFNAYARLQQKIADYFSLFADAQVRTINYNINGFRDNPTIVINSKYNFFNPKVGISFRKNGWNSYLSYGKASKEPNRDDFEAGAEQQPVPETLRDVEFGFEKTATKYNAGITLYYMNYKNQLVLTGKINDVGAYTRTNIAASYRAGIEMQAGVKPANWLQIAGNITLSRNKIKNFTEYIDDYDNGGQVVNHYKETDISYSPSIISAGTVTIKPVKNINIDLLSKYVGKQFLDNTSNDARKLNSFYVQDARVIYTFKKKFLKEINITGQVNNIFNKKYEPNGYTFSYIYGGLQTENYYFPMAGTNFLLAVNIKL